MIPLGKGVLAGGAGIEWLKKAEPPAEKVAQKLLLGSQLTTNIAGQMILPHAGKLSGRALTIASPLILLRIA
jgi:hypothetical protein